MSKASRKYEAKMKKRQERIAASIARKAAKKISSPAPAFRNQSIARKAAKKAARTGPPVASNESKQHPVKWTLERQAIADLDRAALAHLRDI